MNSLPMAQIRTDHDGAPLKASVVALDPAGAEVEMEDRRYEPAQMVPGNPAHVLIIRGGALYAASAEIISSQGCRVSLRFVRPAQRLQRREMPRREFDVVVQFRTVHHSGIASPWRMARGVDIGLGGLAMQTSGIVEAQTEIDVSFLLPGESLISNKNSGSESTAQALETRPIRASGQIVHVRPKGDVETGFISGVKFRHIEPAFQMRIAWYLGAGATASVRGRRFDSGK